MVKTFEQFNEDDPFGEEDWVDNQIKYRNYDGKEDVYDWLLDIGIKDHDVQNLKNASKEYIKIYGDKFKFIGFDNILFPLLYNIKNGYVISDGNFNSLVGAFILNSLKLNLGDDKTYEQFNELDPYGEEDWGDDDILHVGDRVICIMTNPRFHDKKGTVVKCHHDNPGVRYTVEFDENIDGFKQYYMYQKNLKIIE